MTVSDFLRRGSTRRPGVKRTREPALRFPPVGHERRGRRAPGARSDVRACAGSTWKLSPAGPGPPAVCAVAASPRLGSDIVGSWGPRGPIWSHLCSSYSEPRLSPRHVKSPQSRDPAPPPEPPWPQALWESCRETDLPQPGHLAADGPATAWARSRGVGWVAALISRLRRINEIKSAGGPDLITSRVSWSFIICAAEG
jgi:hypothetical protein